MNMIEAIQKEQKRVRELLTQYEAIPEGAFGAMMLKQALKAGDVSIATGDVVGMITALQNLKECTG